MLCTLPILTLQYAELCWKNVKRTDEALGYLSAGALFVEEPATEAARFFYEQDEDIIAWWGSRVECLSAVVHAIRHGRLSAAAEGLARSHLRELFEQGVGEVVPSDEVRDRAEPLLGIH